MKRLIILLLGLVLLGCTATATQTETTATQTEQTQTSADASALDGTYIHVSESGGSYGEYTIDTANKTMTVTAFDPYDGYEPQFVETQPLTIVDENTVQTEDGLLFSYSPEGLVVNGGVLVLMRKIEPKEEERTLKNPIATITMADGKTMTIELYPSVAPETVANFITLANSGFYDGVKFHRIYSGFMIQGGDPTGTGTGGPGYSIKGEFAANGFVQNTLSHKRGVLSMARASSYNSAGSQFFVMHADSQSLNGLYAAFGVMTDGFETLDAIAATPVTANAYGEKSVPLEDVVIGSIRVETFGGDYSQFSKLQ